MILPLPVKKNKFGQRVADISLEDYYHQIVEEVSEAHTAAIIASFVDILRNEGCGQCAEFFNCNEPEELVDIITCCITRLEFLGYDADKRQKLYQAVNDKNKKRGYFDD